MFRKNEYACFTFTTNDGEPDIADGNIVEVGPNSIVIDYDNVHGPATRMRIKLSQIHSIYS